MKRLRSLTVAALILLACAGCRKNIRLQALPALQGGQGTLRVTLTYDRNNILEVRLTGVKPPESFGPQYTRYVVWTEVAGAAGPAVNVGQIRVEAPGTGSLNTLTPLRRFHVLITVEEKGDARQPGPLAVFRTEKELAW